MSKIAQCSKMMAQVDAFSLNTNIYLAGILGHGEVPGGPVTFEMQY